MIFITVYKVMYGNIAHKSCSIAYFFTLKEKQNEKANNHKLLCIVLAGGVAGRGNAFKSKNTVGNAYRGDKAYF